MTWILILLLSHLAFFLLGVLFENRKHMSIWQRGFDDAKKIYQRKI